MIVRYFYRELSDDIIEVIQNACGCCPFDLLITKGNKFRDSYSLSFDTQKQIEKYLIQKRWVELLEPSNKDDEIEKLSAKLKKAIEQRDNYSKELVMTDLEHEYFKTRDNKEINELKIYKGE
jgi:hypothetical protein